LGWAVLCGLVVDTSMVGVWRWVPVGGLLMVVAGGVAHFNFFCFESFIKFNFLINFKDFYFLFFIFKN
jgi:hypothetical protein